MANKTAQGCLISDPWGGSSFNPSTDSPKGLPRVCGGRLLSPGDRMPSLGVRGSGRGLDAASLTKLSGTVAGLTSSQVMLMLLASGPPLEL